MDVDVFLKWMAIDTELNILNHDSKKMAEDQDMFLRAVIRVGAFLGKIV